MDKKLLNAKQELHKYTLTLVFIR